MENKDPLRVDETISRIERQQGVLGVLILNNDGRLESLFLFTFDITSMSCSDLLIYLLGVVIRSSMDNVLTIQYSTLMSQLAAMARGVVRDLDPEVKLILCVCDFIWLSLWTIIFR